MLLRTPPAAHAPCPASAAASAGAGTAAGTAAAAADASQELTSGLADSGAMVAASCTMAAGRPLTTADHWSMLGTSLQRVGPQVASVRRVAAMWRRCSPSPPPPPHACHHPSVHECSHLVKLP
jgi:hypothetical protein